MSEEIDAKLKAQSFKFYPIEKIWIDHNSGLHVARIAFVRQFVGFSSNTMSLNLLKPCLGGSEKVVPNAEQIDSKGTIWIPNV